MNEREKIILDLINKGFNCNQICEQLNISNITLFNELTHLKTAGFEFKREYFSDGSIQYSKISTLTDVINFGKGINNRIITKPTEQEMTFMVVSDVHLGSKYEGLVLLNEVYNYCIKQGINIIFNIGDLVDGTFGQKEKTIEPYSQIQYLIENYPFDKSILNFCVGGDHDISLLEHIGQNICTTLHNYRHDIIIPSFANVFVKLKNDFILLNHATTNGKHLKSYDSYTMALIGHLHGLFNAQISNKGNFNVFVPTLSSMTDYTPSAIEMTVAFENGYIKEVILKNIGFFDGRSYIINELAFVFPRKESEFIKNEFDYQFQKIKKL